MDKIVKIYNTEVSSLLLDDLTVIYLNKIEQNKTELPELSQNLQKLEISRNLTCNCCKMAFNDVLEQRRHYKSDWHRYNLKLGLKNVAPITEDVFEEMTQTEDVSSISGSDTDEEAPQVNASYQGKLYLRNKSSGRVFGIYRSLVHEKKQVPQNDDVLVEIVKQAPKKLTWTVLMIGGGHFAGAVYEGDRILVHKTFHLYTCRAKQGGAQYKEGNARSAGASLRRYNELSLNQHIAELLETWSAHIEKSHLIFYRAAGPFNRTALFGGKAPTLKKGDPRLRSIPFCTKRPTFTELKRVHDLLTNVEIFESIEELRSRFQIDKLEEMGRSRRLESPPKNKNINRAKSRESKETSREVPGLVDELVDDSSTSDSDIKLQIQDEIISFEGLNDTHMTKPRPRRRPKPTKPPKKPQPTPEIPQPTPQIPTPKLTDEELAERAARKQAQKKAKREREKEKRKENNIKIKEEEERNRYLKLSDREKRALAAERRILAQSSQVLVRCFLCGEDISGRVPFEYSGNRFCSMSCLKAHRIQNPVILS